MKFELQTSHGNITVDDSMVVMASESYDIFEGIQDKYQGPVKLYVVLGAYGPLAVVFARCEQDAMDDAADAGKLDGLKIDESDTDFDIESDTYNGEEVLRLGNASEPFDQSYLGIVEIPVPKFSLAGLLFAAMVDADNDGDSTYTYYKTTGWGGKTK